MKLFENLALAESPPEPLAIETPLGTVVSSVAVDSYSLTSENSNFFYELATGGWAARWELPACEAEVIISRPALIPEYRAEITDCWAFLWRFDVLEPLKKLVFESSWVDGYTWSEGGQDSGQWLNAQTWDDAQTTVTLGMDGDDSLFARAQKNDWLPRRFVRQSKDEYSLEIVNYFEQGLSIDFGSVFPREMFQAHFAVAWSPYNEDSIGTWNAVQVNADEILNGAWEKM